jgi:hypothetical protein
MVQHIAVQHVRVANDAVPTLSPYRQAKLTGFQTVHPLKKNGYTNTLTHQLLSLALPSPLSRTFSSAEQT